MKIKIQKIGKNTFPKKDGSGNMTIITALTEDGKKVKAWGSAWADQNMVEGKELDVETEQKKDRDGFDETWIKAPKSGFAPRSFNLWPQAYQVAIQYCGIGADLDQLDAMAKYFYQKFNPGQIVSTTVQNGSDDQPHPAENTVNSDHIPF